jgi:hypothetical protein
MGADCCSNQGVFKSRLRGVEFFLDGLDALKIKYINSFVD